MVYTNIGFIWDLFKEAKNIKKHGVSFEEASSVFYDENVVEVYDSDNSASEDRFRVIGYSNNNRLLFVVYVEKEVEKFRIISARKANKLERFLYEEEKKHING